MSTDHHQEFPQLRCSEHKSPIILVSPDFKDNQKNFFCSRCIAVGQNKTTDALMVIEDFINYIATPANINVESSEEDKALAAAKKQALGQYEAHIEGEKNLLTNLSAELSSQYEEKCNEMVGELKDVLEGQSGLYNNYYTRFQQEIAADNEQEAHIPKFSEIRSKVEELKDMVAIEEYLTQVVKQKVAWQAASEQLRTLGGRTEQFYSEQISKMSSNQPQFSSKDAIISLWKTGLNQLIEKVKSQSGCFNNIYSTNQNVVLTLQNIPEILLLTNEMLKPDTQIVLNLSQTKITLEQAQQIGAHLALLSNLRALSIVSENNHIATASLDEILKGVAALTGLKVLIVNTYGNKLGDSFTLALGKAIGQLVNLQSLQLEIGMNHLTTVAIENISAELSNLTQLKSFSLDAKYNQINDVTTLAAAIATFSSALTNLNISLGGYSVSKNSLTTNSAQQLVRSIRHFTNLTSLVLDLGYTGLDDQGAIELSQSLKELKSLKIVSLQLYSNSVDAKGAAKVAKRIAKISKITQVILNLNFNEKIKLEGAREIVGTFRQMVNLTSLELSLIKVGVDKEQSIILKEDLSKNKLGSPFEKIVVLF